MKKIVSLLLILCLMGTSVFVLAEAADLYGDWYGSLYGMAMQLTFKDDGTYAMSLGENEMPGGKFELKDGIVYMDGDEDPDNGFAFDGTYLVNETQQVTLSRDASAAESITIAEADTTAPLEAFAGAWSCKYVSMMGMAVDIDKVPLEQIGASQKPGLLIDGNKVEMTGLENVAGSDPLEMEFADGALFLDLGALLGSSDFALSIKIQMLQDGMVALEIVVGEESMSFVFTRAEAETPAA